MDHVNRAGAVLAAMLVLVLGAEPAPAAKGVKKTGEHTYRGTVVAVHRKGKTEHLTIATKHHQRKKGLKTLYGSPPGWVTVPGPTA